MNYCRLRDCRLADCRLDDWQNIGINLKSKIYDLKLFDIARRGRDVNINVV